MPCRRHAARQASGRSAGGHRRGIRRWRASCGCQLLGLRLGARHCPGFAQSPRSPIRGFRPGAAGCGSWALCRREQHGVVHHGNRAVERVRAEALVTVQVGAGAQATLARATPGTVVAILVLGWNDQQWWRLVRYLLHLVERHVVGHDCVGTAIGGSHGTARWHDLR